MKRMLWFVCLLFVLNVSFAGAQEMFNAGGNFVIATPQGEFKDNVDNVGLGLSGYFMFHIPNSPLSLGLTGGYMAYGRETREEPWSTTIPDVRVDVVTTNAIVNFGLMARLQAPQGGLRPYVDGLLGFNYLFTDTEVRDQGDYEEVARSTNFDDFATYYGIGAGLWIRVFSGEMADSEKEYSVFIDLGVQYTAGNEAEYLKRGSVEIDENNKVHYDVLKSTTDMLKYKIGVGFSF